MTLNPSVYQVCNTGPRYLSLNVKLLWSVKRTSPGLGADTSGPQDISRGIRDLILTKVQSKMISDSPTRAKRRSYPRRDVDSARKHWSDSQKVEAVKTYLILGSVTLTAGALKIPRETLKYWRTMQWWREIEADLKTEDELQMSSRLKKIVAKSLDLVEDRLEHGNFVFDQKTGDIRRIPVPLKDVQATAIAAITQRDVIATRNYEKLNDGQIENKLEKLAERFAELAAKKIVQIKDEERTIELVEEIDDAVSTEWSKKLQNGEREVQLETGTEEEAEFEDDGSEESERGRYDFQR